VSQSVGRSEAFNNQNRLRFEQPQSYGLNCLAINQWVVSSSPDRGAKPTISRLTNTKGPTAGRVIPPDYLRLEYLLSSASSLDAAAGGRVSLMTRSLLEMVFPYKSLFHSSSWRSVAPSSDMPTKSPRARE
jgi:hypothetical protein